MFRFIHSIQQDLKLFLYLHVLMMVFRLAFIGIYASQLSGVSAGDVGAALWLGARISLKTAAFLTAFPFLFATIPNAFYSAWPAERIRFVLGSIATGVMTFLFMVRIPYYEIFGESFNIMIFNGMEDDIDAIWDTAVGQYQFWPRLAVAIVLITIFVLIWRRIVSTGTYRPTSHIRLITGIIIVFIPVFSIFCRFGGAFHSDDGVPWESAARTRSKLLNEAILDDGQALYRARMMHKRSTERILKDISESELRHAIAIMGGNDHAKTIDEAFTRRAAGGPKIKRPHHVVVILGENYALWPLLPEYRTLGLAKTGEWLEQSGAHCYHFLPNGSGTMTSLNGFITGLPDIGTYVNYTMGKHGDVDQLGIGAMMKKMGYKTVFWYGGLRSWQDIGQFTMREGFDEFHCADELPDLGESSSWGVPDGELFNAIATQMDREEEDTFYFILTTSNHPPFAYDVDSKGFPRADVIKSLPSSIPTDKSTIDQLGHIWYADEVMGQFIRSVTEQDPSTLVVVTGDHAERFSFATSESLWALSGIPCYFYGDSIPTTLFTDKMAGSHLQIAPTIAELILPEGTAYESLLPSITSSQRAFNHRLYIENNQIGEQRNLKDDNFMDYIEAARTIAIWRVTKGNKIM